MTRIVIAGSSGLVGSALIKQLATRGDHVTRLLRNREALSDNTPSSLWDPYKRKIDTEEIEGHDAAICLSGADISESRWTSDRMKVLIESRIKPTAFLSETIARLRRKPSTFIVASATGFYGSMPTDESADETSPAGEGFLADLCRRWEDSASAARTAGIRTAHLRLGVILTPEGGALAKMLPVFRKGLGGKIGSGRQMMSWITLSDAIRAILHVLNDPSLAGPINIVSPEAVSNAEFTQALGRVLSKPALAFLPASAARLVFGKMATETILSSQNIAPRKLVESGFQFGQPALEQALRDMLL